jgi:biopolymer transport protein ExbD
MGRRFKLKIDHNSEFDLDLAPLLAVMVKLVPVLLISSAFVQMMVIETELPQVVQQAIAKQEQNPKAAQVSIEASKKDGIRLIVTEDGKQKVEVVGLNSEKEFDLPALQTKLQALKKTHPEIFKIEFNPDADIAYKEIVRIMDEARKSRSKDVRFPVKDEKTGQETTTDYMFPEVVFANMMDG